MYECDALLVLEGTNDQSYLSSFIKSYYFVTNGYDIKKDDLDYLLAVSFVRPIILLVDPDEAGEKIRTAIKKYVSNNIIDIRLNFKNSSLKHGVFECPKAIIIETLKPYFSSYQPGALTITDLIELGIYSDTKKRSLIENHYCLSRTNNKTLLKRLNCLKIKKEDLINFL